MSPANIQVSNLLFKHLYDPYKIYTCSKYLIDPMYIFKFVSNFTNIIVNMFMKSV